MPFRREKGIAGLAPKAVPAFEGMVASSRAHSFERHVNEFINEWRAEPILERYVQQRMRQLGVRPRQVGVIDDVETGTAFSLEHSMGGRNSRPAWNPLVTKGGINVDYGVFDPEFLSGKAPSWATASLRDRIDAVIIHELTEYNSRAESTAVRHVSAILRSPSTTSDISPAARRILEEYRSWHLQQGR